MNAVSTPTNRAIGRRVSKVFCARLLTSFSFFALACGSVVSKAPILSEYNPDGIMLRYVQEFSGMEEKGYEGLGDFDQNSEQPWQAYMDVEKPRDFFSVKLRDQKSGETRLLFTLWAPDVESGIRTDARWSADRKALQIAGQTRGFSYHPIPDADPKKAESFNFIYLVEEDKMFSVPTGVPTLQSSIR